MARSGWTNRTPQSSGRQLRNPKTAASSQHRRCRRTRRASLETLEPIVLLSVNPSGDSATYIRGSEVSNYSMMFEVSDGGDVRQVTTDVALYGLFGTTEFDGGDTSHVEVPHQSSFQTSEGTFAMTFQADDIFGYHALFSKDAHGEQPGHLSAFVADGRVKVRLQTSSDSHYLWSPQGSVETGETHHVGVTFGPGGFWLYLDGKMVDWKTDLSQGLQGNTENLVVGASTWSRSPDSPDHTSNHFDGRIIDFAFYGRQFSRQDVAMEAGGGYEPPQVPGRIYGSNADEQLSGQDVHAGYGNDVVVGTPDNDRLDGGHGEDRLEGGDGDDLLISRADGREPQIAQQYDSTDDPLGLVNPLTRTLNPDQPIEADDVLVGGRGADTFRFEPLINAKEHILLKHTMDNGMIHWHGVAGENTYVHDHWVDRLGNEVIEDFSRAEGDKIEIVGHTVDVYHLEHVDTDGDGLLDASVLHLQSNQGNAGAHNRDKLGTITVFGDLVMRSDYFVDSKPAYGIVDTIFELDEALRPLAGTPVADDGTPPPFPNPADGQLPAGGIMGVMPPVEFTGERKDFLEVAHNPALELPAGTVSLTFTADDVFGSHALFSKDAYGNQQGGHLTAFVYDGRIKVRLQSAEEDIWLRSAEGSVLPGDEHHVAVTFGQDGFWLYLDGQMVDWSTEFTQGLESNNATLAIGASIWSRSPDNPDSSWDYFDGTIRDFVFYDSQMDRHQVANLAGYEFQPIQVPGRVYGTDESETLTGADVDAGYGDDTVFGTAGNDRLDGGHGEDRLEGGAGNDLLISRADGREPRLAQDYIVAEDDPYNELDPLTRTVYSNQPIEADDVLNGGAGADTFRFEVLINAKERIILKHVMDNRMIHWHGVAGENTYVHDHWVDRLGNDVIEDFNRAEGDKIEVVGHTVDVYHLEHVDTDLDGILDASVLYVQSNQGNAGAHNRDLLGTITVFGDLVLESDYTVDSKPAYGIVNTIDELDEALAPRRGTPVSEDGTPPPLPVPNDGVLPVDAVFGVLNEFELTGEDDDHIEVAHSVAIELSQGTIATSFVADNIWGRNAIFSKDAYGEQDGHLTVFVTDGHLEARLQSSSETVKLYSAEGTVLEGVEYHVAVTFGASGFSLYLDGQIVDIESSFTQGMSANDNNLVIGGNGWGRSDEHPYRVYDEFDGRMHDFVIYGRQLSAGEIAIVASS